MVTSMISSPIPTAPGLPLVGNALAYRRNRLALWMQVRETCGDIGLVRLGSRSLLLVSSPELIHAVLVEQADHFEKSPLFRRVMEPILGNGLVTSENAFHKRQRKLIAPAFPHRQLTSLVPLMAQATEHLQSQWQDGEVIDLAQQMMQLTLVISGEVPYQECAFPTRPTVCHGRGVYRAWCDRSSHRLREKVRRERPKLNRWHRAAFPASEQAPRQNAQVFKGEIRCIRNNELKRRESCPMLLTHIAS